MSKRSRLCEFSAKEREKIHKRDNETCLFCRLGYHMSSQAGIGDLQIAHFVARSQGGMGVEQNGALLCIYHHQMLDNGNLGNRHEMETLFREYLKSFYPDWSEDSLKYNKWSFLERKE